MRECEIYCNNASVYKSSASFTGKAKYVDYVHSYMNHASVTLLPSGCNIVYTSVFYIVFIATFPSSVN